MKKIYLTLLPALFVLSSHATIFTVTVSNNVFSPDNFTVTVGDTVIWTWMSGNHTSTSTSVPVGAGTWDAAMNQNSPVFLYQVTMPGLYNYQCTFHASMGMIGQFTAVQSSGIHENTYGVSLNVYANPATKELEMDLTTTKSGMMDLTLNDITGRQAMLLASDQQSAGQHHLQYSVANLPRGIYMLKLSIGNDDFLRKVILQ
jgi:plastocyanin